MLLLTVYTVNSLQERVNETQESNDEAISFIQDQMLANEAVGYEFTKGSDELVSKHFDKQLDRLFQEYKILIYLRYTKLQFRNLY